MLIVTFSTLFVAIYLVTTEYKKNKKKKQLINRITKCVKSDRLAEKTSNIIKNDKEENETAITKLRPNYKDKIKYVFNNLILFTISLLRKIINRIRIKKEDGENDDKQI